MPDPQSSSAHQAAEPQVIVIGSERNLDKLGQRPPLQETTDLAETMWEQSGSPLRFLVIRLSSIGDIVHALPAVAALGQSFPKAKSIGSSKIAMLPFWRETLTYTA